MSDALISRHFDATRLNEVINHPAVHPWVCGSIEGQLDMTPAVADRRNVLLMGEHGGIIFHCHQPGLYEAHTQVVPEGRGQWCLDMTNAALHWMFARTDCIEVLTRVPKGNYAARTLTKAAGLTSRFINPHGWAYGKRVVAAEVFGLTIQDWIAKAPELHGLGSAVRERLDRLKPSIAIDTCDEGNDRHLAAAFAMIVGGQPEKGVVFFNRWAAMTDQPPLAMFSRKPLAFNRNGVLIVFRATGEFYSVGNDLRAAS